MTKRVLVSACLLGHNCRYDEVIKRNDEIINLLKDHEIIPVCPEVMGGLDTPRIPSEIKNGKVINKKNKDNTEYFVAGANYALETYKKYKCDFAILKAKSPSCGKGQIYDGTFSGKLIEGNGMFVDLLLKENIVVFTENEIDKIKAYLIK